MLISKNPCIIGREHNVLIVDFTRKPEPPAPKFPGANAKRRCQRPITARIREVSGVNLNWELDAMNL
jgi:hypothetical protein